MTDRRRLLRDAEPRRSLSCLLEQIEHAVAAGIDVVQIRERDLEAAPLMRLVAEAVALAKGSATRIVVNDRLDVALAAGAGGVHLPANAISPPAARTLVPRGFLIGRSVHSVAEAIEVSPSVDYLIAGTVWPTVSKGGGATLLGVAGLAAIAERATVPVLAIGGVTLERLEEASAAGAAGIAAIGLFTGQQTNGCAAVSLVSTAAAARGRFAVGQRQ